jgi:hypothetical protein
MRISVGKSVHSLEPEQSNMQAEPRRTENLPMTMKPNSELIANDYRPAAPFSPDLDQQRSPIFSSILHCKSIIVKRRVHLLSRPHHRVQDYSTPGPLFLTIPQPPQQPCAPSTASSIKSLHV